MAGFGEDDFVSFDFGDDGDVILGDAPAATGTGTSTANGNARAGPSSRPTTPTTNGNASGNKQRSRDSRRDTAEERGGGAGRDNKGKKRKYDDDEDDDDGMTKKERERAAARGTPWSESVSWHTARNAAQMLHREMIAFERWLSPTREEHECRKMVIALIRKAIVSQWRDANVLSFGSQDTELYLPQGDIDLVVVSEQMDYQRREGVLRSMAACLRRNNLATDVQVIARAKVPIIKFVCTHGRYRCDISVNQTNGLKAAEWVNGIQDRMPAVRPLIMLTKQLLQQRGYSEVYTGGLGSFSVILLVISFMQVHPKVQRGEIDPTRNLGVLFLDFLELYGKNFGYDDTGISVRGRGGYFSKSRRGWRDTNKPFKLSLEDPQNPDNDIAVGSYNMNQVKAALAGAFDILTGAVSERGYELARGRGQGHGHGRGRGGANGSHRRFGDEDEDQEAREALVRSQQASSRSAGGGLEKDPQSLLGNIIGVSKELMKHRQDIEKLYRSGVLQRLLGRPPPGRSPSPGPSNRSRREGERERERERDRDRRREGDRKREREKEREREQDRDRRRPPSPLEPPPRVPSPPPRKDADDGSDDGVEAVIHVSQGSRPRKRRVDSKDGSDKDEDDDVDSRYSSRAKSKPKAKAKAEGAGSRRPAPGLQELEPYISEESGSESESSESGDKGRGFSVSRSRASSGSGSGSGSASPEEGEVRSAKKDMGKAKAGGAAAAADKERRSRNRNFWLDKAGVSFGHYGSSNEDEQAEEEEVEEEE